MPEGALRQRLLGLLERADVTVESVRADAGLWERIRGHDAHVVLVRRSQIPEERAGLLAAVADRRDSPEIVVISDDESPADRARLLAAGAARVVNESSPSGEMEDTLESLASAVADGGLDGPEVGGKPVEPRLADFISRNPRMKEFLDTVQRVVGTDSSLLITGETGVGKERLARAIHAAGPRSAGPFVTVNCGALAGNLLESELFGHERGAFTGAESPRRGQFDLADGGTVFLDEVGDMPGALQVKLLRVLQSREIQRLGSERSRRVDVRVMAATNRDLGRDVEAGRFRRDLFYRLNVVRLEIPPLRERKEDIADLVGNVIKHFRDTLDRNEVEGIGDEALEALLRYDFPGNVRELINVIERAMLLCRGRLIQPADLPKSIARAGGDRSRGGGGSTSLALPGRAFNLADGLPETWLRRPFREARTALVHEFEKAYLDGLLRKTRGAVGETARLAGMSSRSVYEKMRRHGLRKEDYRS